MFHRFPLASAMSQRFSRGVATGLLGATLSWGVVQLQLPAHSAETSPARLMQVVEQLDRAASAKDLTQLLQVYSPNFEHEDGLNRQAFSQALEEFWNQYSALSYSTEVVSSEATDAGWILETVTTITGRRQEQERDFQLEAIVKSRQTFVEEQLVRQEILSEESKVTTGSRPPQLSVSLPEQVKPGQSFSFDVVVLEPLEDDLLLGGVLDEPIRANAYPNLSEVTIEPLVDPQTGTGPGGIFKVGQAPSRPQNRWVSAVVVRKDGITMVTRRLQVTN